MFALAIIFVILYLAVVTPLLRRELALMRAEDREMAAVQAKLFEIRRELNLL